MVYVVKRICIPNCTSLVFCRCKVYWSIKMLHPSAVYQYCSWLLQCLPYTESQGSKWTGLCLYITSMRAVECTLKRADPPPLPPPPPLSHKHPRPIYLQWLSWIGLRDLCQPLLDVWSNRQGCDSGYCTAEESSCRSTLSELVLW